MVKRWQVFKLSSHPRWNRSSPPEVFWGKGNLKISSKFTEHSCRSVILIKLLCNFIEINLRDGFCPINFCRFPQHLLKRAPLKWFWWDPYFCSRPEVFCKKGVLRNFARFTGKYLCQSLFFNKSDSDCDCDFSVEVPWISLIQAMDDIEFDFAPELQCLSAECQ